MNPLILLFGGALLLASRKRRKPKSAASQEPPVPPGGAWPDSGPSSGGGLSGMSSTIAARVPFGKLWEQCKAPPGSPTGTYAAFGPQGECVVFWNPQTWISMGDFLEAEFAKLSKKQRNKICKPDDCIPNPYAPGMDSEIFCEWKPNPDREKFVIRIVQAAFPQFKEYQFPTSEGDPFFPRMVWTFTNNIFASAICGIGRVT